MRKLIVISLFVVFCLTPIAVLAEHSAVDRGSLELGVGNIAQFAFWVGYNYEQETILGLAIDQLGDMEWLDIEKLQAPNNVADHIAPYLQGEWVAEENTNQVLRLLDQVAILRSARWAT